MTRNAGGPAPPPEKQYPTRACDFCRRRKTKCDGRERARTAETQKDSGTTGSALDVRCSNCMISGADCTYGSNPMPRGYPKAYVENLERCQDDMSKLIMRLLPYIDLTETCGPTVTPGSWREDATSPGGSGPKHRRTSADDGPLVLRPSGATDSSEGASKVIRSLKVDIKRFPTVLTAAAADIKKKEIVDFEHWRDPSAGNQDDDALTESDEEYCGPTPVLLGTIDDDDELGPGMRPRFHGKSSGFSLVRANLERKGTTQLMPEAKDVQLDPETKGTRTDPPTDWEAKKDGPDDPLAWPSGSPGPALPPPDLLGILVDLYFRHVNIVWPLLHRPTFETDLVAQRHERDLSFRCVVIAICAVASRYCNDPRVLAQVQRWPGNTDDSASSPSMLPWEGSNPWVDDPEDPYGYEDAPAISAGWKYYNRIAKYNINGPGPVRLTELQTSYLTHQYLLGLPNSYSGYGWVMVGAAIRKAQDQGAHREKSYHKDGEKPSLEGELWRRAFWCLVIADRICSAVLGQCCCIRDEDIDAELPLEVDDEFWSSSNGKSSLQYQQPVDRPSYITAFNVYAKLSLIHVWALRTLYAIDESKAHLGLSGEGWEKDVVARLNEALDEWIISVPPHLKWDPNQTNHVWRTQSANLYLTYHLLQMRIYQPFSPGAKILGPSPKPYPSSTRATGLPLTRAPSTVATSFPALAICANAARSNAHILGCLLSSHSNSDSGTGVPLSDVTTLIAGAFLTGVMLVTVSSAKTHSGAAASSQQKGQGDIAPDDPTSLAKLSEAIADDQKRLDICADVLKTLSDRWLRASSGLALLMSAVDAVPCADLLRAHAYPESQAHSSPSLSPNWSGSPQTPPAAPSPPFPEVAPPVAIAGDSYEAQHEADYVKVVPLSRQFHAFSFAPEFVSASPPSTSGHETPTKPVLPTSAAHQVVDPAPYLQMPLHANETAVWGALPATDQTILPHAVSPSTPQSTDEFDPYPWNSTMLPQQSYPVVSQSNAERHHFGYSAPHDFTFLSDDRPLFHTIEHQQPAPQPQYNAQGQPFMGPDQFGNFYSGYYPDQWSGYQA